MPANFCILAPLQDSHARELRAVIRDNRLWLTNTLRRVLEAGQDVNLLIDAFPYQKFGVQKGIISEISSTPFRPGELDAPVPFEQAVFRVDVILYKQTVSAYGNEVLLKPGMTLQGDLITDRRSLMQWMLDPLLTIKRG